MSNPMQGKQRSERLSGDHCRRQLLAGLPIEERRLELAGISTAVLEGGEGPPLVLLHDPAEYAAKWMRVIPDLVTTHRVVAPDLPGHGSSEVLDGSLDIDHVLGWLGELVDRTCASPPAVVGLMLGGAIAARFAAVHGDRLSQLILVDSLGLGPLEPAPEFTAVMMDFLEQPSEGTLEELWRQCAFDLDALRERMGDRWKPFAGYIVDQSRTPSVQAALHTLMEQFGFPAIPPEDLVRIDVPTTLVWGRHDPASPLRGAEAASIRYGWPLHIIEQAGDDPPIEQPEAFLKALRAALGHAPAGRVSNP